MQEEEWCQTALDNTHKQPLFQFGAAVELQLADGVVREIPHDSRNFKLFHDGKENGCDAIYCSLFGLAQKKQM